MAGVPLAMPVKAVEDLTPQSKPVPEGAWQGTIEETRIRPATFLDGKSQAELEKQGFTSDEVEFFSAQIGQLKGLEGQEDVGNKKFFTPDIVVQDGEYSVFDMNIPDAAWQLQRSQRALLNFANALGFTEIIEIEGEQSYALVENFEETLREGGLVNQEVGFVVYHNKYKTRKGEDRIGEEVKTYLAAV